MKILHAAETLKGGPATIIRQLALAQTSSGEDVHILVPASDAAELGLANGTRIITFARRGRGLLDLLRFALRFLLIVLETKPQIVHLHSSFSGAICRPLLMVIRPLVRPAVVYSPHCWAFVAVHGRVAKHLAGWIEAVLSRCTDVTICGSAFEKAVAQSFPIRGRLEVVPSAVEPPMNRQEPPPPPDGRKVFAFVGRFDEQKGFDLLLEAAERVAPTEFRFVAVGGYVRDSGSLPKSQHVEYVPWQDRLGLADIYRSATALIMPSRWESFGLVAVEAMSYGLPVIASNCCSLPEIVQHGVNGWLFPTGDVDELVRTINSLSLDEYRAASANCAETYRSKYTTDRMVAGCAQVYASASSR